jgi:hypothetical protein
MAIEEQHPDPIQPVLERLDKVELLLGEALVKKLLADPTYKTDAERIEAFEAHADGRKRRTWFNIKKKLGGNGKPAT